MTRSCYVQILVLSDNQTQTDHNYPILSTWLVALLFLLLVLTYASYSFLPPSKRLNIHPTQLVTDFLALLIIRRAQESDFGLYLKMYPDLEIDAPPVVRKVWTQEHMPGVLIATIKNAPVGYIWLHNYDEVFYITYLIIARDWRRKGVGGRILEMLKDIAMERGYKKWGLHCDILHAIPHRMYLRAGMQVRGSLLHVKAPIESVLAYEKEDRRLTLVITDDPEEWTKLESKYDIISGNTRVAVNHGYLPVKLVIEDVCVVGYVLYSPCRLTSWAPSVDKLEYLPALLHGLRQFQQKSPSRALLYEHYWIRQKMEMAMHMLTMISGAILCETCDYLVGDLG